MAFANTNITDIAATTLVHRNPQVADNLKNNNGLLSRLGERGNIKTVDGGEYIMEQVFYNDPSTNNARPYSGYQPLDITPNSPISGAAFNFCQYSSAVSMSGLDEIKNSGREKMIDLLDTRIEIAETSLQNVLNQHMYLDGTSFGGTAITGLAAAIPDDPTTGTYGGLNRATWSFWQSQKYSGITDGGAAVSSMNIIQYMTALALKCVRGPDMPDLWVSGNPYYGMYVNALQAIQRITSDSASTVGAGFPSLKFEGGGIRADVVYDGGIGGAATASHMWALNTKYIYLRPYKGRNFVPLEARMSINQDATVIPYVWAGNLTSSGPQFSGVLSA